MRTDTALRTPLLSSAATGLAAHLAALGPLPDLAEQVLVHMIAASGLTGRGGAGFPVARKIATVRATRRRDAVVVANGSEGEPDSHKDHALLLASPHLVLDGLAVAAAAVGATRTVLYAHDEGVLQRVRAARDERAAAEAAGTVRAVGPAARTLELVVAPLRYIAGETSAVVAAVEGRPALPRDRRLLPAVSGVRGRPTLVQNVETLAHLGLLARLGADWFRTSGTAAEPGTMLISLNGAVARPGVYETALGTPLTAVLELAGGPVEAIRAVLVGGFHGRWVPGDQLPELSLSRAGLAAVGGSPGAGVLNVLGMSESGLHATARITRYLAGQSAGQCGPCRFGLPALADAVEAVAAGHAPPGALDDCATLLTFVERRGACTHPDGTAGMVRSGLGAFSHEAGPPDGRAGHLADRGTS